MKKIIALMVVASIAGLSLAGMVTIHTDNSWDLPVESNSIETILLKNGIAYENYIQVDMSTWFISNAEFLILGEIAGGKDLNIFGWYNARNDGTKPSELHTIFLGPESDGNLKTVQFSSLFNTAIGFYLDPVNNGLNGTDIFFSESDLNNGNGQLAVFQNKIDTNDYILAWEDLSLKNGCSAVNPMVYSATAKTDGDYNDFIVQFKVVPEPGIFQMFLGSLIFIFGISVLSKNRGMFTVDMSKKSKVPDSYKVN